MLPCAFPVTYPKHAASLRQCGGGSLRRPLSLHRALLPLPLALGNAGCGVHSRLLMLMPAKILFWPKPGSWAGLRAIPACIPHASAFLVTLLIQGISAFSKIQLTLQHSALVSGLACFLLGLFCACSVRTSSCPSKTSCSLLIFPLQRASQTFHT